MNNQRNNNRRRGRGNNRGGNGGGNPVNRIDSRARGNAPQMLEKYRKLAHEASLNDDRVQTEYYLQFADHYFRVIADAKAQKDEQQGQARPRSDRDAEDGDDYFEDDRFDDRSRRPQQQRQDRAQPGDEDDGEGQRGAEGDAVDEEANPFLAPRQQRNNRDRDNRDREGRDREGRNRNDRRPRREDNRDSGRAASDDEAAPAFDPGMLPPSISRPAVADEAEVPVDTGEAAPAPKPRRPRTRRKSEDEGGDEALEAVG